MSVYDNIIQGFHEAIAYEHGEVTARVVQFESPNADTNLAIHEVELLKKDPNKRVYNSFSEVLAEFDEDDIN